MAHDVYKYYFFDHVPFQEVQESLLLSFLATEALYGRSTVKLDAYFQIHERERTCIIDAETQVGRHISCIFVGFLSQQFGEEAFKVERVSKEVEMPATDEAIEHESQGIRGERK